MEIFAGINFHSFCGFRVPQNIYYIALLLKYFKRKVLRKFSCVNFIGFESAKVSPASESFHIYDILISKTRH